MTLSLDTWAGHVSPLIRVWPYLLGVTVRGSLLVLLTAAVLGLWSRASAAQRHLVWVIVCGSLVLLPVLQVVVPAWHLPVLSEEVRSSLHVLTAPAHVPTAPAPSILRHTPLTVWRGTDSASSGTRWILLMLVGWGIGCLGVLAMLVLNQRHLRRLVATATPLSHAHMLALVAQVEQTLNFHRRVTVLEHPDTLPLVCGVFRPVILLPTSARGWDESRLRNVLLHELAHVRRWDMLYQLVATVAVVLYWFNPLVWLANRALRLEREQACDDVVLDAGGRPGDYATDLLDLTEKFQSLQATSVAALAFVKPSQLQTRVHAILDRSRRRDVVSARGALTVGSAGLFLVYPFIGVTLGARGLSAVPRIGVIHDTHWPAELVHRPASDSAGASNPRKTNHDSLTMFKDGRKATVKMPATAATPADTSRTGPTTSDTPPREPKAVGDTLVTLPIGGYSYSPLIFHVGLRGNTVVEKAADRRTLEGLKAMDENEQTVVALAVGYRYMHMDWNSDHPFLYNIDKEW